MIVETIVVLVQMTQGDDCMRKSFCQDCVCLVEGPNGEWICDEADMEIETLTHCPENFVPSAENGDYGPSNPWDSPGYKISDFIGGVI